MRLAVDTRTLSMAEHVYYKNRDVRITLTRAIFPSRTYALSGITSVGAIEIWPNRTFPALLIALGLLWFLFAAGIFASGLPATGTAALFLAAGALFSVGGIVWWLLQSPKYAVELRTAAGEFQAYVSAEEEIVDSIVEAVEQAIIDRG
jgi:hypothetical protein